MRLIKTSLLFASGMALLLAACSKVADLPLYTSGSSTVLSASSTNVAPPPADSNKVALTLSWTDPKYATDSANYKFTIEIDSAGKNFSAPLTKTVLTSRSVDFIAKELNNFLLARNYAFNVPVDLDARVISSYANNNERLVSNTIRIKVTPYKIPPRVPLPTAGRVFIVGDATTFGWTNDATPAFPAAREFARLDETTWGGIFYMNGTGAYKLLQTQGVWSTQFHMINGGTATGGSFIQEDADPAFPSPSTAGWYKIMLDFQTGKYTVTPFGTNALPQDLWITGDATAGGWVNNPSATQKFSRLNSAEYEIQMVFVAGKAYKFLSSNGSWQPQFGGSSATSGTLGANYGGGSDPDAVPTPSVNGNYKVRVNFYSNTYRVYQ